MTHFKNDAAAYKKFKDLKCGEASESTLNALLHAMFEIGDTVKHIETGGIYRIEEIPIANRKLEYCNEYYYAYTPIKYPEQGYVRRQSEMEDGRFEIYEGM